MCLHPIISIVLAAALAVGGVMPPRYACACADGTQSIEVGRPFCEESDRCTASGSVDQDELYVPDCTQPHCSSQDCRSTLLSTDPAVVSEPTKGDAHGELGVLPVMAHPSVIPDGWEHRLATDAPPSSMSHPRRPGDGLFQLCFVVLLI